MCKNLERKHHLIFVFVLIITLIQSIRGDDILWTVDTTVALPDGVSLYKGNRNTPLLQLFYLDVDLNKSELALRPYLSGVNMIVPTFTEEVGAYVAINGGFFGGNTSYSTVVIPGEIQAINVTAVTRNNSSYPIIRSLFSMDTLKSLSVDWIYHFNQTVEGLYRFEQPLPYINNDPNPLPAPQIQDGVPYTTILTGIGGAPTLVKNGQVNITYDEEIMWDSGVGYDNSDPRTAVGYTTENHVIMLVADGRQPSISDGVGLPELAQIMIDLGCVEAMNLDGGGSTQMALPGSYLNSPSEQRAVPTILAVVHIDSLGLPKKPLIEKVIDTEDEDCQLIGAGWFPTANPGFWGDTPSMLHGKGIGENYAEYTINAPRNAFYDLFAWWVAAGNRCTDTPFIITHNEGVDTVRLDQSGQGSQWVKIGTYYFEGDTTEKVLISDFASTGTYIVADAIRLTTFDTVTTSLTTKRSTTYADNFILEQNYPNPFNPITTINYKIPVTCYVEVSIYTSLGEKVATLVSEQQSAGYHQTVWNASGFASAIYYYRLSTEAGFVETKKLVLIK